MDTTVACVLRRRGDDYLESVEASFSGWMRFYLWCCNIKGCSCRSQIYTYARSSVAGAGRC
ncbi:MAG: hypothetical protein ACPGF8_07880, partial [Opitutales bacterium]